jgi:hypothetical protein
MGAEFIGHALPGVFILILALWWLLRLGSWNDTSLCVGSFQHMASLVRVKSKTQPLPSIVIQLFALILILREMAVSGWRFIMIRIRTWLATLCLLCLVWWKFQLGRCLDVPRNRLMRFRHSSCILLMPFVWAVLVCSFLSTWMVRLIHLRCFVSFDVFSRTGHLRRANSRNPLRNRTVHGHCTHLGNGEILSKSGFGKDLHLHRFGFWLISAGVMLEIYGDREMLVMFVPIWFVVL